MPLRGSLQPGARGRRQRRGPGKGKTEQVPADCQKGPELRERMREIALHLLDIAENSAAADSQNVSIEVHEDLFQDLLTASVTDDGRGMDVETAKNVQDPFYTTRTTRK